ncbi:MAG: methyltransferase domain-containing protein [Candidatus Nealsonbacteria bacterium]
MDKKYAEYLLRKTRDDYNSIAEDFSSTRRFVWQGLEPLYHYATPGDKVLDLGCGNGRLLQIFKDINIDYTGVDNSEKLIGIAKKTHPGATFLVADALNLPFPPNHFDKIYSVAVLHHIPSQELRLKFLEEAKRALKPEGLLILTVWDLWRGKSWKLNLRFGLLKLLRTSKLDFKDVFVSWAKKYQRYLHCFTNRELIKLVKKAGFKVKETGTLEMKEGGGVNIFIVAQK